jgi:y4mF family transcriptional regulator
MNDNDLNNDTSIGLVRQLGELIRAARKRQRMTQEDVSGLAGLGNRFVIDPERGKETIQMQKALDVMRLLGLELIVQKA